MSSSLKEKRKELLNEWLKPRTDACEREIFKQVFYEIEKQDKEFIKKLKEELNNQVGTFIDLRHYHIFKKEIDKLAGY